MSLVLTPEELALVKKLRKWPSVRVYAQAMCKKLDENEAKKGRREGWVDSDPRELLDRVKGETLKLENEIEFVMVLGEAEATNHEAILREAADVGNMAMMAADAAGAIKL